MTEIEQRNPFLARLAIGRGAYQRPPQAQVSPYAVQFGQGLGATYYQPTPQMNLNPNAAQSLGNFFWRNAAANNAQPYQNPQYQRIPLSAQGNQAMVVPAAQQQANQIYRDNVAPIIDEYVTPQLIQNALLLSGTGGTLGGIASRAAYPAAVMATSYLGNRLAAPALNAINKVANSPVSKWGSKVIDWFF